MSDPKWLKIARGELGTMELPGPLSNPSVVKYYIDAIGKVQADAVPWCAAFVGYCLVKRGLRGSGSLMAKSYVQIWHADGAATWRHCHISTREAWPVFRPCHVYREH